MCGFFTAIPISNHLNIDNLKDDLFNASKFISHRGPDSNSSEIYSDGSFFSHYRLSIIDTTDASNQPLKSACKRYILCFNGEIYNYKELSEKYLPGKSYKGDTDVLLSLLINVDLNKFLNEIEGMFSFVYYDKLTKSFYAARDRFGIKPLYYSFDSNYAYIASEPYPIQKVTKASIDKQSIDELVQFRRPSPGFSFYKDIFECLPGNYISHNSRECKIWEGSYPVPSEANYSNDELYERLKYVFSLNTIADLPHCSFQSAGIDSSLISYLTKPKTVYTIGLEHDNEISQANLIAKKLNINIVTEKIGKIEYFSILKDYLSIKREPISVPNEILIYKLCKTMGKNHKFFLSGEGADEIFFGYDQIFRWAYEKDVKKTNNDFIFEFLKKYSYSKKEFNNQRIFSFCEKLLNEAGSYLNFVEDFFISFHLPGLLARADRASMAAGKEARVPFCSQTILNYMYRRPFEIKIKDNNSKLPLRSIIKKTKISSILSQPKIGFKTILPGLSREEMYNTINGEFLKSYEK